jgi:hypothetical protein
LRGAGLPAPEPLAVGEVRRFGLLHRAILVTAAWPGDTVESLLRQDLPDRDRDALIEAVRRFVERLHELGFRDRNLDLRNLLARRDPAGVFEIAKLDSPRHRIVRAGRRDDRLASEDRERLGASFRSLGLELPAGSP